MKNFHSRIEQLIVAAQAEDRLRRDIAAADAAYLLIGLVQGLILRWSLSGRDFDLSAEGERLLGVQLSTFGASRPVTV